MATVSFRLDNPKQKDGSLKTGPVAVRVCLYVSKFKRPEVSTTLSLEPRHWHEDKERAKATLTGHTKFNLRLDDIQRELALLWENNKEADRDHLKRLIQEYFRGSDWNKPTPEKKNDAPFVAYIKSFILDCKSEDEKGNPKKVTRPRAPETITGYEQTLNILESFSKDEKYELTFEAVDLKFYRLFTAYLWDVVGLTDNTVGKHIKNIKTWMNCSLEEEEHTSRGHQKKSFKKIEAETDEIALTEKEILKFYHVDCSSNRVTQVRRDAFVLDCWIGIRIGDLCKKNSYQIETFLTGKAVRIFTKKTQTGVLIPAHPIVEEILDKYHGAFPKITEEESPQFNSDLKQIARRAGINTISQTRETIRGKAKISFVPKWKLVSAHTARRSFATNCYLMGIPIITIMQITGHRTEKAFLKYIRISKDQHAQIMLSHFNKMQGEGIMRKVV